MLGPGTRGGGRSRWEFPGSHLELGPVLAIEAIWEVNHRKEDLCLSLSLSVTLPFKQINTSLKINKVKKEVFQVAIPHILKPQPNAGST